MRRAANRRAIEPVLSPNNAVRGCSGKRQYSDKTTAARMAKRTRRQYESKAAEYKCRCCGFWHVGSAE